MKTDDLQLVPDEAVLSEPLFMTEKDHQAFCAEFYDDIKPALDRNLEARRLSEEDAKRHLIY